jgi:hypothetical protein
VNACGRTACTVRWKQGSLNSRQAARLRRLAPTRHDLDGSASAAKAGASPTSGRAHPKVVEGKLCADL